MAGHMQPAIGVPLSGSGGGGDVFIGSAVPPPHSPWYRTVTPWQSAWQELERVVLPETQTGAQRAKQMQSLPAVPLSGTGTGGGLTGKGVGGLVSWAAPHGPL